MGFFDSPRVGIAKRIPKEALVLLVAIETDAEQQLGGIDQKKREYALGIILSIWACNCYTGGFLNLTDHNYRWISNMGNNCARFLDDDLMPMVYEVIEDLVEKGLIPMEDTGKT